MGALLETLNLHLSGLASALAHQLFELLEFLAQLVLLFIGHLLLAHAVDVFRPFVEIVRGQSEVLHEVFGGLLQVTIEAV